MTIYDKLKINYEKGGLDTVIRCENSYRIFSVVESDGTIRSSHWETSIEVCKNTIGTFSSSKGDIEKNSKSGNWKIVKTIARESHYEIGDKVKLRNSEDKEIGKVLHSSGNCKNSYHCAFDGRLNIYGIVEIEPYFGEEETEELTLKQVCKELGRDIKIIK